MYVHTEEVVHLRGENGQRNTCREAHNHRIRHKLDDTAQLEHAHENKHDTRHDCGDEQARESVLLNHTIDNHNERARRTANLHFATTESRDDKSCNDSRDKTFSWSDARGDTKSNCQWDSHYADDNSCHRVLQQFLFGVALQRMEELRLKNIVE